MDRKGEVEAIPGKDHARDFKVVTRDYKNLYNQFISYGPNVPTGRAWELTAPATMCEDFYDE